ncbi:MAG: D-alanyl-D-alanine carboxypeptidase/D-alanyl-D-alanine-endopeptidase [Thermoleophilia bacterium]
MAVAFGVGGNERAAAAVADDIPAILAQQGIAAQNAGIYIWDLESARPVYTWNADQLFTPASNQKLVTSATALINWGANHRFVTGLSMSDVPIENGVLDGDLFLCGYGDPSLSTRAYQRRELGFTTASLERFARALSALGVRTVTGSVIADAHWFDAKRTVASWKPGIEATACGPISALSVNQGFQDEERVSDPVLFAATKFTEVLRKAGIKVTGAPREGRLAADAVLVKQQSSAPLKQLLKRLNKMSDNHFAETFTKGLGKDFGEAGTTAAGVRLSRATLASMDIPASSFVIDDGSGLSYLDRLTPHGIVRLLGCMYQRPDFAAYYDSLAIAGKDGTLAERMRNTPAAGNAHAKTGYLNVATSLSGYVRSANGHLLAFSLLMAIDPTQWQQAHDAQDAIVATLADATVPGACVLRVTPTRRQQIMSSIAAVHTVGSALQPCVEP